MLRRYFASGWAFFLPYLAAYLLFAAFRGPSGTGGSAGISLLAIFRLLHVIHAVLGLVALYGFGKGGMVESGRADSPASLAGVLPWVALAFFYWVPGLYLEWPSDPWEHLRRTAEWAALPEIGGHSAGYKAFYFLSYSLLPGPWAARWPLLTLLQAGLGLLLSWQHFRLALAAGLDRRWSFVFVVVISVTTGSSAFAFHRYYGLATTMYSQIAAIALIRLLLAGHALNANARDPGRIPAAVGLVALMAANHVQGVAIALFGGLAIAAWRITTGGRARFGTAALVLVLASATVIAFLPRHPAVDEIFRAHSWLNAWYGFDLLDLDSPAAVRAYEILGLFGVVNLVAGAALLRRNHVVGWLTVGPALWLLVPAIALPFANLLAAKGAEQIVTFHRLFFAIPSGLALVVWVERWTRAGPVTGYSRAAAAAGSVALFLLVMLPSPGTGGQGRLWHATVVPPADLQIKPVLATAVPAAQALAERSQWRLITTAPLAALFRGLVPSRQPRQGDIPIGQPPAESLAKFTREFSAASGVAYALTEAQTEPSWTVFAGDPPEPTNPPTTSGRAPAIQNPPGRATELLSAQLYELDSRLKYQVEAGLRVSRGADGMARLGIAWYDSERRLLPAAPSAPTGWDNGTFSYFALLNAPAATEHWTIHRISFGAGTSRSIPAAARYFRFAALLNSPARAGVVAQVIAPQVRSLPADVRVASDSVSRSDEAIIAFIPPSRAVQSPYSLAAKLSRHWPAEQVAADFAGAAELEAVTRASGASEVAAGAWLLPPPGPSVPLKTENR